MKSYSKRAGLEAVADTPSWSWPQGTDTLLLEILSDEEANDADRLLAAELAGDLVVINDRIVEALLRSLDDPCGPEQLRGAAAISLGPVLELSYTDGFELEDDVPIDERSYVRIRAALRALYESPETPKRVRRRVLEAAVRAPEEWHEAAVRRPTRAMTPTGD